MRFSSSRLGLLACGLLMAGSLAVAACDGNNEAALGERCFVTTDCAAGLVCIPSGEDGSATTCSNNVAGIQKEPTKPGGGMTSGTTPTGDGGGSSSGEPAGDGGSSSGESSSSSSGGASSSSSSGGSSSSSASSSSSSSGSPDAGDDGGA